MPQINDHFLELSKRLKHLADVGLLYATNEYDKERYGELREIGLSLMTEAGGSSVWEIKNCFPVEKDYPTAKTDIRVFVLSPDGKILLVKEAADGNWSVPGGWADIGYTPAEIAVKECLEETGLQVTVKQLLAVFDKRKHPHPPQPFYVYKMVFYCEVTGGEIKKGFDVLEAGYFDINDLPPLSEDRILGSQLQLLYKKVVEKDLTTYFD